MREFLLLCENDINNFTFTTCEKVLINNFKSLKARQMKKSEEKIESKNEFILKPGRVLQHKANSYTHVNLTDEVSLEWVSENPSRINAFDNPPEDWAEKVEALKESKKSEAEKAEAERLAGIEADIKADLVSLAKEKHDVDLDEALTVEEMKAEILRLNEGPQETEEEKAEREEAEAAEAKKAEDEKAEALQAKKDEIVKEVKEKFNVDLDASLSLTKLKAAKAELKKKK